MLSVQKGYELHLQTAVIYGAVVLKVICLPSYLTAAFGCRTVSPSPRKLGVEEQDIKGLVMKQLGVWFGLPVVVSITISILILLLVCYFLSTWIPLPRYDHRNRPQ